MALLAAAISQEAIFLLQRRPKNRLLPFPAGHLSLLPCGAKARCGEVSNENWTATIHSVDFHWAKDVGNAKTFSNRSNVFVGVCCGRRENLNARIELTETQYLTMPFADDATGELTRLRPVNLPLPITTSP